MLQYILYVCIYVYTSLPKQLLGRRIKYTNAELRVKLYCVKLKLFYTT